MRRVGSCLLAVCLLACRKPAKPGPTIANDSHGEAGTEAGTKQDAGADAEVGPQEVGGEAGTSTVVAPPPPMPKAACTPDAKVRWWVELPDPTSYGTGSASGPEAFACSPFRTGASPLELTMAPGTMLEMPLGIEAAADGVAWEGVFEPTHVSTGLPKGAWIDPADKTLKWKVAGKDGDVLSFTVGAIAPAIGPKACAVAEIVVRVRDDDTTRKAQAATLAASDSLPVALAPHVVPGLAPTGEAKTLLDRARCGAPAIQPAFFDADGDGLADALFVYPGRGGGEPTETSVWVRRKDTYARLGRAVGTPHQTADGATFLVDTTSSGTGFSCSIGIKIHQVMGNRLQLKLTESTQSPLDPVGTSCPPGDGIHDDYDAGKFLGFTDQATKGGVVKKRVFRWNGKHFALTP